MAGKYTFTIIKPFAVKHGYIGPILAKINEAGFRIVAMKYIHLKLEEAKAFYAVHESRPFYEALVSFMSSGPIVVAIVEKENAVEEYRKLIGSTNPSEAAEGTIRRLFGTNIQANAVHGSDSDENVVIESNFFFSMRERFLNY
jgi:nucleoside-diphosphate kinase